MQEESFTKLLDLEFPEAASNLQVREALLRLARDLTHEGARRAGALLPWLHALGSAASPDFLALGPEALDATSNTAAWLEEKNPRLTSIRRELLLARLLELGDQAFCDALLEDTDAAAAVLDALRDGEAYPVGRRVRRLMPWLADLRLPSAGQASPEHERPPQTPRPLLDHLAQRVLPRKLAALERGAWRQSGLGLGTPEIQSLVDRLRRVREAGLLPVLRAALLHLDISKAREDHNPTIHNLASAAMLRDETPPGFATRGLLQRFTVFREKPELAGVVDALVAAHGLSGQHLRGEITADLLEPWRTFTRTGASAPGPAGVLYDLLALVDACDTAGVREGLLTSGLWRRFEMVHEALRGAERLEPLRLLDLPRTQDPVEALARRLARLRSDRIAAGEDAAKIPKLLAGLSAKARGRFEALFSRCQVWYCERATSELTPEGQLRLLALAMRRAEIDPTIDETRPYHVNFKPLMLQLWPDGRLEHYRVRLLEALLEPLALEEILTSDAPVNTWMPSDGSRQDLGTFLGRIGGETSIEVRFEPSAEAQALLTLLPIYELKRPAAFHSTLKDLCDLYGLRKDEYDRVSNEASYLATMNAARDDKARMLDFVQPGRIVEVGPGGGVVLDLLEERFPDSEILGLDVSEMVIAALERKRALEKRRWNVRQGDAFELAAMFGRRSLSGVVFCSILHEIYSYVPWPVDPEGNRKKFQFGSVEAMLRAAFRCLKPGGRIVIRDGVMPPPGRRILRFKTPDGPTTLELYAKEFEGRPIRFEWLRPGLARMSSADAMAFLYTYTWGPDAFPYEVREQYGILTLADYQRALLDWLHDADPGYAPRLIQACSYLQPGYIQGLAHLVELYEGTNADLDHLQPVALPDSNCLLVIEKLDAPQ